MDLQVTSSSVPTSLLASAMASSSAAASSSSSSSSSAAPAEPAFTEEQLARARASCEPVLRELEEDVEAPAFRAALQAFLAALARRSAQHAAQQEREKKLRQELDLSRLALAEARNTEEDLAGAVRQSREDAERLDADLTKARSQLHASNKSVAERRARIAGLEALKALGSGWTSDQTRDREALEAQVNSAAAALEAKQGALATARQEVNLLASHVERAQGVKSEQDRGVSATKEAIARLRAEALTLLRAKEAKDAELRSSQGRVLTLTSELKGKTGSAEAGQAEVLAAQESLKLDRQQLDRLIKDYDRIKARSLRLTGDIDEQMHVNEKAAAELDELRVSAESFQREEGRLRQEAVKNGKLQALTAEKIKESEAKLAELQARLSELGAKASQVEEETRASKARADSQRQSLGDMEREKEVLAKGLLKQGDKAKGAAAAVSAQQGMRRALESEVAGYVATLRRLRAEVDSLQESRVRLAAEADAAAEAFFAAAEGVKLQELQVAALTKRLGEGQTKLGQQQKLYEEVKADRNDYSKQLVLAHAEIAEMKRVFKDASRRVEALKEDIMAKDQALVKHHFDHHRVDTEKEALRLEVARVQKQIQACEHIVSNQEVETRKLTAIASEAEAEFSRQRKELDAVRAERTLLLQQLEKRDVELTQLYGKLLAQKSVLSNGAASFARRAAERDATAAKVASRKGELLLMTTQLSDTRALELECLKLESDLQREKAKIRSLTEELERPINIHRWRALEDRDPEKWALIQRTHNLQRRVLEARGELRARDEALRAAEAEFAELRGHLAKMPSARSDEGTPEVVASLQAKLKDKARQARSLEADLEAQRALCEDFKRELARVDEGLERLAQEHVRRMRARRRQTAAGGGAGSALAQAAMQARALDDMALGAGGAGGAGGGIEAADALLARYGMIPRGRGRDSLLETKGEGKEA